MRCCSACLLAGPSRLPFTPRSRVITATARYEGQIRYISLKRRNSRRKDSKEKEQGSSDQSDQSNQTLFGTLFEKLRDKIGPKREPLTHQQMLGMSLRASTPASIARPTTKFGLTKPTNLPPMIMEDQSSRAVPLSPRTTRILLEQKVRGRAARLAALGDAGKTTHDGLGYGAGPTSTVLEAEKRGKSGNVASVEKRKYHWLKWSRDKGESEKTSEDVFRDLMEGSLLKPEEQETKLGLKMEDAEDEVTREKLDLLHEVAEEHEAGIESYKMTETEKKGRIKIQHGKLNGRDINIEEVRPVRDIPVATLKRGLSRTLFNPSVHFVRDPRSHVYNFETEIERVPQADEFAFHRLPQYITASEDEDLYELVKRNDMKYYGSTSTLTKALSQIYFYISGGREISTNNLTQAFADERTDFPAGAKLPAMLWVRAMEDGKYAVDNDKRWDIDENVLSDLGRVMEKMVTSDQKELKRFMLSSPESAVSDEERNAREAYRYCKGSNLLMRSQLDCYDERLPGSGTFDIKTRAAVVIRHDRANYEENSAYDVYKLTGLNNSFEKEFYDMARSAFLKYSMQVRIGGMDGIFVVYHNTARIFGFQYVPLTEMDEILHGCSAMGEQAFKLSVTLLEKILEESTALFPDQTINLVIDANQQSTATGVLAFITPQPGPDDPIKTDDDQLPVIRLRVGVTNKLDGKIIHGPIDFASVAAAGDMNKVVWTMEYEIEKTTMDEEGYTVARKGLGVARKRYTNMTSLNLPTGKTVGDMQEKGKGEDEAGNGNAMEGGEVVRKDADGKGSKMNHVDDVVDVIPDIKDKDTLKDTHKDKEEKRAHLKWKSPDGRILALRKLARESGKEYEERISGTRGKKAVVWRP